MGERAGIVVEKRFSRKDGQVVWAESSMSLTRDAEGNPRHVVALVQDITNRKRAEDALLASERRFRAVFDCALDAILIADDCGWRSRVSRT
jgi:PAS domain-containing protein